MASSTVKYHYAYDENHNMVSIDDVQEETRYEHKYYCISCGEELLPRLGKSRAHHFFHKNQTDSCSSETYLHILGKKMLKEKFDKSEHFYIEYDVKEECSDTTCPFHDIFCRKKDATRKFDLKQYYDTATIEVPIKDFVADILLTSSKNTKLPPILLEVCFTHECKEDKINSGLKIIELQIGNENDIFSIYESEVISSAGSFYEKKKNQEIRFYSFTKDYKVNRVESLYRYVYGPEIGDDGYLTKISCADRGKRLRASSTIEFNIADREEPQKRAVMNYMADNHNFRRCALCKYYKKARSKSRYKCRLDKTQGTPTYPPMSQAETCKFYRRDGMENDWHFSIDSNCVEVVKSPYSGLPEYKVTIVVDIEFADFLYFRERCDFYLQKKLESCNVILLSGQDENWLIERYAKQRGLQLEKHLLEFGTPGAFEKRNEEELSRSDALIVFRNNKSQLISRLISDAKRRGISVAEIPWNYRSLPGFNVRIVDVYVDEDEPHLLVVEGYVFIDEPCSVFSLNLEIDMTFSIEHWPDSTLQQVGHFIRAELYDYWEQNHNLMPLEMLKVFVYEKFKG